MTNAGWYPDPAGQPQTYRYWDGQSWSEETTGDPYAPAPGSTPPQYGTGYGQSGVGDATVVTPQQPQQPYPPQPPSQPPGQPPTSPPPTAPGVPAGYGAIPPSQPGYGQGGYGQGPYGGSPAQPGYGPLPTSTPPSGGRGSGTTIAIVLIAVLVLVALGVGGFFGVKALTDDDDTTASDDSSETVDESEDPTDPTDATTSGSDQTTGPTESTTGPTDSTTGPTTLQCGGGSPAPEEPRKDNQISGGGLTMPVVSGFDVDTLQSGPFTFADGFTPQIRIIEEGWIALYGVGALNKANGFETPEQAAEIVTQCMTASTQIYDGFSGRTDLESGPITIDGRDAFSLETEIRVDNPDISVEGDRAQVIVVDTGDADTWGLYISVVALGDATLIDQQADTVDQIEVK